MCGQFLAFRGSAVRCSKSNFLACFQSDDWMVGNETLFLAYSPGGHLLGDQAGSLAIVCTEEQIALRYQIYIKAPGGSFVP